jgi:hypothetical protein
MRVWLQAPGVGDEVLWWCVVARMCRWAYLKTQGVVWARHVMRFGRGESVGERLMFCPAHAIGRVARVSSGAYDAT